MEGPAEVPPGDYTFVLFNETDDPQALYVSYVFDGHTYQDLVDMQGTPGRYWPKPDWVEYADVLDGWMNESRTVYFATYALEEGEVVVYTGSNRPATLWFCAPLKVTEAASN